MTTSTRVRSGMTAVERDLLPLESGFVAYWDGMDRSRRELLRAARATYADFRADFGYVREAAPLLTLPESQPKTGKSETRTLTLMLAPARSVLGNACPAASKGCSHACLNTAGKGAMSSVQHARMVRMAFMVTYPHHAGVILAHELIGERMASDGAIGLRLNCVSDVRWERVAPRMLETLLASSFVLYDYSAYAPELREGRPDGYSLTYSAKEHHSDEWIADMVREGHNVAVPVAVRKGQQLPDSWRGLPAVDGDATDWRPGDPTGVVVLLRAKGQAITDRSGFVRLP